MQFILEKKTVKDWSYFDLSDVNDLRMKESWEKLLPSFARMKIRQVSVPKPRHNRKNRKGCTYCTLYGNGGCHNCKRWKVANRHEIKNCCYCGLFLLDCKCSLTPEISSQIETVMMLMRDGNEYEKKIQEQKNAEEDEAFRSLGVVEHENVRLDQMAEEFRPVIGSLKGSFSSEIKVIVKRCQEGNKSRIGNFFSPLEDQKNG